MRIGNKDFCFIKPTHNQYGFWLDRIDSRLTWIGLGVVILTIEAYNR